MRLLAVNLLQVASDLEVSENDEICVQPVYSCSASLHSRVRGRQDEGPLHPLETPPPPPGAICLTDVMSQADDVIHALAQFAMVSVQLSWQFLARNRRTVPSAHMKGLQVLFKVLQGLKGPKRVHRASNWPKPAGN